MNLNLLISKMLLSKIKKDNTLLNRMKPEEMVNVGFLLAPLGVKTFLTIEMLDNNPTMTVELFDTEEVRPTLTEKFGELEY